MKAFTLVEVMFAMAILAIGILGVIMLQGVAIQGNMSAKDVAVATMLANDTIDRLLGSSWAAPVGVGNAILADTSTIASSGSTSNPATFPNGFRRDPGNPYDSSCTPTEGSPVANPISEGDHKYFVAWRIDDDPNNAVLKANCLLPLQTGDSDPSCSKAINVRVQWLDRGLVRHIDVDTIKTSGF
jgi:prepilin-type N-terminal cleavage/methylation domain-containing protein